MRNVSDKSCKEIKTHILHSLIQLHYLKIYIFYKFPNSFLYTRNHFHMLAPIFISKFSFSIYLSMFQSHSLRSMIWHHRSHLVLLCSRDYS
jgi:hypothetical protein